MSVKRRLNIGSTSTLKLVAGGVGGGKAGAGRVADRRVDRADEL